MSRRRKQARAEKENSERWLLTYADLITLLLAFFMMLFATSNQDLQKFQELAKSLNSAFSGGGSGVLKAGGDQVLQGGGSILPDSSLSATADFDTISRDLKAFAATNDIAAKVGVRTDQRDIVVSLSNNLLFNTADAKLRPEALPLLDRLAGQLRALPNEIRVEGHTDNIPLNTDSYASNWELSAARATAVLRYLTERAGLDPARAYAAAYADTRPVLDNRTPEGRAQNRRADIVIIYPPATPPQADPAAPQLTEEPR